MVSRVLDTVLTIDTVAQNSHVRMQSSHDIASSLPITRSTEEQNRRHIDCNTCCKEIIVQASLLRVEFFQR